MSFGKAFFRSSNAQTIGSNEIGYFDAYSLRAAASGITQPAQALTRGLGRAAAILPPKLLASASRQYGGGKHGIKLTQ